jgi:O-antigen ligase
MIWLLGGYMWLCIHRPFEYYPMLGDLQLERGYFLMMFAFWAVAPNKGFLSNRLHVALVAFTSVLLVCWLASPFRDMERCSNTIESYLKVAMFYVLVVTSVRDEKSLRRLLALFLIAVGCYMGHSLLEYVNGRFVYAQGIVRMVGVDVTYADPNAFASTMLLALPLTLPFWSHTRSLGVRLWLASFTVVACVCILLTGSRTGYVGLAVFGLCCLLLARSKVRMVLVLAVAVVLLAAFSPDSLQDRFLTLVDPSRGPANAQESAQGRIGGFLEGFHLWDENPVLGVGPGAFLYATGLGYNSHNVYGQVVSEMGAVGVVAFAAVLLCFYLNWRETRRHYRGRPPDFLYHVSRAVALNVLLLLFMGWAGHNLYRYNWLWFAAFQAVALHCIRLQAAAEPASRLAALPQRWGYLPAPAHLPFAAGFGKGQEVGA